MDIVCGDGITYKTTWLKSEMFNKQTKNGKHVGWLNVIMLDYN